MNELQDVQDQSKQSQSHALPISDNRSEQIFDLRKKAEIPIQKNNEPPKQSNDIEFNKWHIIILILISLIILGAIIATIIILVRKNSDSEEKTKNLLNSPYFCMVDGGSTSSKLYIYDLQKQTKDSFPTIKELKENKIKPGIANIEEDEELTSHIKELLSVCEKEINKVNQKTQIDLKKVPFFF